MFHAIGHTSSVRQAGGSRQMLPWGRYHGGMSADLLSLEEALQRLAGAFPPDIFRVLRGLAKETTIDAELDR